ncbi:MAG: hypothetical protein C4320_00355 [Armatimonadota bacterium]
MKKTLALAAFALAAAHSFAGVSTMAVAQNSGRGDVVDMLASRGQFKTLLSLVKRANLTAQLRDPLPITVFAPTDAAFAKVPKKTLETILSSQEILQEVLLYHVVPADANLAVLQPDVQIPSYTGYAIRFNRRGSLVRVDNVPVVRANIRATNGVIHTIDSVLLPPRFTGRWR